METLRKQESREQDKRIMEEKRENVKSLIDYLNNSGKQKSYIYHEEQLNLIVTFPKKQDAMDTMKEIHRIFQYKMVMCVKAKKLYILY